MLSEQQQKILVYFIEESREHLQTLEQGLMNLQVNSTDGELINELFRAAHSIKGGAAMLGFDSIRRTAHRLEDSLKVLRERSITVDQRLESLFLQGFDLLQDLVDQLQKRGSLDEEAAQAVLQRSEPIFAELAKELSGEAPAEAVAAPAALTHADIAPQVLLLLRQMLDLFRQGDSATHRQQLLDITEQLAHVGQGIDSWQTLVGQVRTAIGLPQNSFAALAKVCLQDLKQGADLIQAGRPAEAIASAQLARLAAGAGGTIPPQALAATITIPTDPQAAADALLKALDTPRLTQLAKLLVQALKQRSV
ncbi:MAG: Hpt domain-containing protein [Gloeomargaritaceae cyanobacterium C42_A2020_066]|nr:Hpt domain-containing protein [Gloeomargaritaceae cyanobacterium C42_A2020_066]